MTTAVPSVPPDLSVSLGRRPGLDAKVLGVAADARRIYATVYFSDPSDGHSSPGPGELVVLDRTTMDPATALRVPVGWQPRKVALDLQHQRLYVLNYGQQSYSVMVFDVRTLQRVGQEIMLGQGSTDLVADTHLGRAYVANSFQRRVHVIDGLTGTALDPILIPGAYGEIGPHAVGFDEALGTLVTTRGLYSGPSAPIDQVIAFDPQAPTQFETLRLAPQTRPSDVAFDPVTRRAYVGRNGVAGGPDPGLAVVDDATLFDGFAPSVSQGLAFKGAATVEVDRFLGLVHVAGGQHLRVVDTETDTVIGEFDFGPTHPVHGLAVAPDSAVYVGAAGSDTAWLWRFTPPGRVRTRPGAPFGATIAVASTGEQSMSVFVPGEDGSVYAATWDDGGGDWSQWSHLGDRSFPLRARLAACSRGGGRWQIAGVDDRGVLVTMGGRGRTPDSGWVDLHDGTRSFPPGAEVTMISRRTGQWLVFAVDDAGEVFSAGADDPHPEPSSGVVPGPVLQPGAPLVAVSRKSDHWDLFTLHDGQVWTTWWSTGDGFHGWGLASSGPLPGGFLPGTRIAVVARKSTQLDVFAVGPDGDVRATFWNSSEGWSAWGSIGGTFPHGTRLAATGRNADQLDVFGIGTDGLQTAFWRKGAGWSSWSRIGDASWTRSGTPVNALTRNANQIDVFWAGNDGGVRTAWWSPSQGQWSSQAGIDRRIPTRMHRHTARIETDAKLGGGVTVDIWVDGSYTLRGYMHDSGWDPYDYSVQTVLRGASGDTGAISHQAGHVDGTGSEPVPWGDPDRDDFWTDIGVNGLISRHFADFETGRVVTDPHYKNAGLGGFFGELGSLLLGLAARSFVLGGSGVAIALLTKGLQALLEQVHPGSGERAGLFVEYGTAFLMSPGGLVPALVEGYVQGEITEALIGYGPMTDDEKTFIRTVFGSSLDDIMHRVRLTNLTNTKGTAIVVPLLGLGDDTGEDIITVNLGEHHDDPLGAEHRDVFVHEMVHVWQIRYAVFTPHWALWTLGEHFEGDAAYEYERDGRRWSGYEYEEQAKLVQDWFKEHVTDAPGGIDSDAAKADDRFRYIEQNLRLGRR